MVGLSVEVDKEGFLKDLSDWSPKIAAELAAQYDIELATEHWEILDTVRGYYERYHISPAMRVLVKVVKEKLGPEKGRSIHLLLLFPERPARLINQIAGLPKPDNCD